MLPWQSEELRQWSIVGMNHYHKGGLRYLFVAMTRGGRCIQAESEMESAVFERLKYQARLLNRQLDRELAAPVAMDKGKS